MIPVDPATLAVEDAEELAEFVAAGGTIPKAKWVDEIRDAIADARNERALALILG